MAATRKPRRGVPPRKRRTPEEARRVILDAAEKRLREGGPDALRLQDIARDAGMSHPTVLHHFESRDGLTQALEMRALDRLEHELLAVLESAPATEDTAQGIVERVFATLGDAGHARLLAWRALQVARPEDVRSEEHGLRKLVDLVHARRSEYRRTHDMPAVPREDSEFTVRLTATAMLGDGIFGPFIDQMLGDRADPEVRRRFRTWFARLLLQHLTQS